MLFQKKKIGMHMYLNVPFVAQMVTSICRGKLINTLLLRQTNSYDKGDNGACGGISKNSIQEGGEIFTGHKVSGETCINIDTLIKPGTTVMIWSLNNLESAINSNLDPKLLQLLKYIYDKNPKTKVLGFSF